MTFRRRDGAPARHVLLPEGELPRLRGGRRRGRRVLAETGFGLEAAHERGGAVAVLGAGVGAGVEAMIGRDEVGEIAGEEGEEVVADAGLEMEHIPAGE